MQPKGLGAECVEGRLDPFTGFFGDRCQGRVAGHVGDDPGVEGLDDRAAVLGADHDVAGQERGDARVDLQGAVGELGVAGAEDDLGFDVKVELVLEGLRTSISVWTPKPWSLSASFTLGMASS